MLKHKSDEEKGCFLIILCQKELGFPIAGWVVVVLFCFILLWLGLLSVFFSPENRPKDRPFVFPPILYLVSFHHSVFILSDVELRCAVSVFQDWK